MEEQSLAVPVYSNGKTSRKKRSNRWLIVAIVIVSLASFVVLGLLVTSILTVNSRPLADRRRTGCRRPLSRTPRRSRGTPSAQTEAARRASWPRTTTKRWSTRTGRPS